METISNESINQSDIGGTEQEKEENFIEILTDSRNKISAIHFEAKGRVIKMEKDTFFYSLVKECLIKKCEEGVPVSFPTKEKRSRKPYSDKLKLLFWDRDIYSSLYGLGLKFGYHSPKTPTHQSPKFYVEISLDQICYVQYIPIVK
jgi:hypothetical protein